jgi:hypothetical protein
MPVGPADSGVVDADADVTTSPEAAAPSVCAEPVLDAGLAHLCVDFNDGTVGALKSVVAGGGSVLLGKGVAGFVLSSEDPRPSYARLQATFPEQWYAFTRVQTDFAVTVPDLNTAVRLFQLNVGATCELRLDVGHTSAAGSGLSVSERPAVGADAGSETLPVTPLVLLTRGVTYRLRVTLERSATSSLAAVALDGTEVFRHKVSAHKEPVSAAGDLLLLGIVSAVQASSSAQLSLDDVVLDVR